MPINTIFRHDFFVTKCNFYNSCVAHLEWRSKRYFNEPMKYYEKFKNFKFYIVTENTAIV